MVDREDVSRICRTIKGGQKPNTTRLQQVPGTGTCSSAEASGHTKKRTAAAASITY